LIFWIEVFQVSLLVVGSVALDSVETPFGKREQTLGGAATFFATSASFYTQVRAVAVVGEDFPQEHLNFLASRGIDLSGIAREKGKTFRWKGRYTFALNEAQTLDTQLNVFQSFAPVLPDSYRDSDYVFLANIHPELQGKVLDQVRSPKLTAMDTMNYWIRETLPQLQKTLRRVDVLFVNDAEARQLSGEHNIFVAAKAIMAMGPKRLVIKRGEYGALLFDQGHMFFCPAYPLTEVFDPTGAGDSFAGGFMGALAQSKHTSHGFLRRAMVHGAVLGSFAVERFSLDRLRDISDEDIRFRFSEFQRLTEFSELPVE